MSGTTKSDREQFGDANGKYPMRTRKDVIDAINLRHNSPTTNPASVLRRASRWANAHNDSALKDKIRKAREKDRA